MVVKGWVLWLAAPPGFGVIAAVVFLPLATYNISYVSQAPVCDADHTDARGWGSGWGNLTSFAEVIDRSSRGVRRHRDVAARLLQVSVNSE